MMETIKVNMTPCEDIKTIHASQDDNEGREWGFELHNNGEKIDSSSISDQLVFKAYEGGTEQILPENTSTPTTSPFKGDIKYPQGLLTDQEFTYRQSPTEEDGLAKITDIKGNTLVWNQLIEKGNMTDGWTFSNTTGSYSNNVLTFTATAKYGFVRPDRPQYIYANHKYFATVDVKATSAFTGRIYFTGHNESFILDPNYTTSWKTFSLVFTNTVTEYNYYPRVFDTRDSGWDAIQIRNCMLFDLTQMGLDITDPSEFTSLFSLPYYAYNQGTLLSFMGNGIKTVGKNIFDGVLQNGTIDQYGQEQTQANRYRTDFLRVFPSTRYVISVDGVIKNVNIFFYDINKNFISSVGGSLVTTPSDCAYMRFYYDQSILNVNLQLEMLKSGNSPTPYEPYVTNTTNLPISTYFPSGMKSAGNVYDELTPSKATPRVGQLILNGTQTPRLTGITLNQVFSFDNLLTSAPCKTVNTNITSIYGIGASYATTAYDSPKVAFSTITTPLLIFPSGRFSNVNELLTYLQSNPVPINYELATPTETEITTSSLVTENAEIPLSNEDGILIGKCTEELSSQPGFIDAKIKLTDGDGTCYSNKIQLHVERKP